MNVRLMRGKERRLVEFDEEYSQYLRNMSNHCHLVVVSPEVVVSLALSPKSLIDVVSNSFRPPA